jgi:hypothetical protein
MTKLDPAGRYYMGHTLEVIILIVLDLWDFANQAGYSRPLSSSEIVSGYHDRHCYCTCQDRRACGREQLRGRCRSMSLEQKGRVTTIIVQQLISRAKVEKERWFKLAI